VTDVVVPGLLLAALLVGALWFGTRALPERLRPRTWWHFLLVFWLAFVGAAAGLDYTVNEPIAREARSRIAGDLAAVPQPSSAVRASYSEDNKASSANVAAGFRATATWSDLRSHFDRVLNDAGWSFVRESGYTRDGHDYGGRVACYVRGNERANVDAPGLDPVRSGLTYSFSISWTLGGPPSCF
jgi:hypothetical protein